MSWPMKRWLEYTMYVSMKINFRHDCVVYIKLYVCYNSHSKEVFDFMETKNISVQLSSQCTKVGGQSVHKSSIFSFTIITFLTLAIIPNLF
jgi:hypothetical protein